MGFLDRPQTKSANPAQKFLNWKSNEKMFSFYDKENKENVMVKLPLTFLVLEEYHTVKGFSDSEQSGIYSNEVLQIGSEEVEVKTFSGKVIAKGFYKNVKSQVEQAGGKYHKSIYAVTKEGELVNISLKGACVSKWSEFTQKGAWKRLKDEWVTIEDAEDQKKGSVKFSTPNFKFNTSLSDAEYNMVSDKAKELLEYMEGYLTNSEVKAEEVEVIEPMALDELPSF